MVVTILATQVYPKRAHPSVFAVSLYPPCIHLPASSEPMKTVVGMLSTTVDGPAFITLMTWNWAVQRSMEPAP